VLDRINSLVEQERSIVVNECGLVDGNPVIIKAHPNFRMFLTVNANYGEVSRAMRNRGVEIFLMDQRWDLKASSVPENRERKDVIRFLISSGIPRMELISSMSKAHMYAKAEGSSIGINITLLEITRWVQLFQQLIIKGNHFLWSLHLSWEHTYLPSLGEVDGSRIVEAGKNMFLTNFGGSEVADARNFGFLTDFDGYSTSLNSGFSLTLPGGWPSEQKLRDFIWYSKETCVKRNCMYLLSLGAQYTAYQINLKERSPLVPLGNMHPYIMPTTSLLELQFPTVSGQSVDALVTGKFDSDLADQMLFFAANWVMEQSTENDIELYTIWFEWYNDLFQPYCNFFENYLYIRKQESEHPIWHCILECYREIVAYHKTNIVSQPIPPLSKKLLDMAGCGALKAFRDRLCNAFSGLRLLRLTLQQWHFETKFSDLALPKSTLLPALKSLRRLEGEVLERIVKSQDLLHIYSRVLDYHRSIWKMMISSQFEGLPVVWNLLRKEIQKLQPKFPEEVGLFLVSYHPFLSLWFMIL
jgi:midasin